LGEHQIIPTKCPLFPTAHAAIAALDQGVYDFGVDEGRETLKRNSESEELRGRINQLEGELERHRSQEQLLVKTLLSATSHATAIRESARQEAEVILRKARVEAEELKAGAIRERDDARRELMRLRRITEQMRSGLSAFLTEKVEELRLETEDEAKASGEEELEAALGRVLEGRSATELGSSPESTPHHRPELLDRGGYDSTGGSPNAVP
jgi:cell division septum initiation protein DivIVA